MSDVLREATVDVPDRVRLELLHGYVQLVTEANDIRLLHLKVLRFTTCCVADRS